MGRIIHLGLDLGFLGALGRSDELGFVHVGFKL